MSAAASLLLLEATLVCVVFLLALAVGLSDTGRRVLAAWRNAENLAGTLARPSASPDG